MKPTKQTFKDKNGIIRRITGGIEWDATLEEILKDPIFNDVEI